nr:MAG TPA: collagen triple helix repeat protein [Caudoviricetes sp.]
MRRCDCDSLKPKTVTGRMVQTIRGAGGGGTLVHGELTGRDAKDQHPISAITGLTEALARSTGVTFTPHVSLDGVISWTNDGGLDNPAPVSVKGAKGDKGETGATGATGAQGERGEKGDKGDAGEPGEAGKAATIAVGTVETGGPGTEASVTNTGTESAAVLHFVIPRGAKGEQGERGLQGERGEPGAKGDPGVQGEPGKDGTSFKVLGLYASLSALQAAHPTGNSGDAWAVGTSEANSIYLWDAEKAQWENIGSIKGQKGEKGDKGDPGERGEQGVQGEVGATGAQGEQGIQGVPGEKGTDGVSPTVAIKAITGGHKVSITDISGTQSFDVLNGAKGEQGVQGIPGEAGAKGDTGEKGADGAKGDPGKAATITIGSVTSGAQASVENAGTANAAVLNFVLPKGDKGEKGDTGLQGAAGEPGAKGDTGEAGKNGTDGKNGEDGFSPTIAVETVENGTKVTITDKTGDKTFTVKNGEKGAQGVQGERGEQGIQGVQGIQGATGATGEKGADGFSPIVAVAKKGTVTTVTMTDASGTTSAEILDGAKGDKGDAGYTPVKGIDYWTSTDITDIENDLKAWTNEQGFLKEHQSLAGYATETWVEGKGYQTAAEVSAAIESAKGLFVVTITPEGKPEESSYSVKAKFTPSVTFAEAVAQAKSGKKVVIGMGDDLDVYIQMHLAGDSLLQSVAAPGLMTSQSIKTFKTFMVQEYKWDSNSLYLEAFKTLPKWIGDTKPAYKASEVGADASGAAAQALTDAKTWVGEQGFQTAAQVQAAVDAKANKPKRVSVTLTASGWNSSAKTQTVTVSGVLADESAQVIQPIPAIASQSAYNAAGILATGQAANSITFTASTVPTADLSVYVVITEVTA